MSKEKYKIVYMPIKVPAISDYCWDWSGTEVICEHFDNEGGHPSCTLGFYPIKRLNSGCVKPEECSKLKTYGELKTEIRMK